MSAEKVKAIIKIHYEPGRQDRCKEWVFRNIIKPQTGISRRTFFRYLKEQEEEIVKDDPNQLKLF
jgi:hypothetical protein